MAFHSNYKPTFPCTESFNLTDKEHSVLNYLRSFFGQTHATTNIAKQVNMSIGSVKSALNSLVEFGLVGNGIINNNHNPRFWAITNEALADQNLFDEEEAKYAPIEKRLEELGIIAMPYTGEVLISFEEMTKLLALIP